MIPCHKETFNLPYTEGHHQNLVAKQDVFSRMFYDLTPEFFIRLIGMLRDYIRDRSKTMGNSNFVRPLADYVAIQIHEGFLSKDHVDALEFMSHLATLSSCKTQLRFIDINYSKCDSSNPFYAKETSAAYRFLFGRPDEVSYATARLCAEFYLLFGGAVYTFVSNYVGLRAWRLNWTFSLDCFTPPATPAFYENFLVSVYGKQLVEFIGLPADVLRELERRTAARKCRCTCVMCGFMRRNCLFACNLGFPWDWIRGDSSADAVTSVDPFPLPVPQTPTPTKKPKEEFEVWSRYPHGAQLLDCFGSADVQLPALYDKILAYLRAERAAVSFRRWIPDDCPEPLVVYVGSKFGDCKIGVMLRQFDDVFRELDASKPDWAEFEKLPQSVVNRKDEHLTLRHQLKLVGLKYSAALHCARALLVVFRKGLLTVGDEYRRGPATSRNREPREVVRHLIGDCRTGPGAVLVEWFWALRNLRAESETRAGAGQSVFLLDAALGFLGQDLDKTLDTLFVAACKTRLREELSKLHFDCGPSDVGEAVPRKFLTDHVWNIQAYLDGADDKKQIEAWTKLLVKKTPSAVPPPQPTKGKPKAGGKRKGKAGKSADSKSAGAVVVKAFQSHVVQISQRLVMLAERLPCPKYDESLEDGAYLTLLETVAVIPHFITFASHHVLPCLHNEFLGAWRTKEEALIAVIFDALEKATSSGIPQYVDALHLLESDEMMLTLACLRAKKVTDTIGRRYVAKMDARMRSHPTVAAVVTDGAPPLDPCDGRAGLARKFCDEVDVPLARATPGSGTVSGSAG